MQNENYNQDRLDKWLSAVNTTLGKAILLVTFVCGIATIVSQIGIYLSNLAIHLVFG